MEMSDDYQDMVNPGGGMANLQPMGEHHQQTPESSPAEADILTTKNSLEVLQAAMNNGVLNLQGFPLPMLPLPNMGIGGMIPQTPSVTTTLPMSVGAEGCSGTATTTQVLNVPMGIGHLDTTSSPSRSSESPRCRSRNGPDSANKIDTCAVSSWFVR